MNPVKLLSLLALVFVTGCGPVVTFHEPMPPNEKDLDVIPMKFRGNYVNDDGSVFLHIDKSQISREYDYDVHIHRDSMTYWDSLVGDTLWDRFNHSSRLVSVDSIGYVSYHVNERELMFAVNPAHVARKFKGYLFLNTAFGESGWTVEQVKLRKGILTINEISSMEQVDALNECVGDNSDTIASSYSPTKKQFREFVKQDGFGNGEEYYRIR